jgi:hypothetical protein
MCRRDGLGVTGCRRGAVDDRDCGSHGRGAVPDRGGFSGIDAGLDGGWAPCRGDRERQRSGFADAAVDATLPAAQLGLSVTPRAVAGGRKEFTMSADSSTKIDLEPTAQSFGEAAARPPFLSGLPVVEVRKIVESVRPIPPGNSLRSDTVDAARLEEIG